MLTAESRARDFPSLASRAYLNTAAEGIPPACVLDALADYGRDKLLGMDGRLPHEERWRETRGRAAAFLGLRAEDIGLCSCSSEAYNLAALALRLRDGDEVIVNELDFPAGATPWLQADSPATVKVWRARDGGLRVDDLIPLLSPRTRLLTVSLVSFYNGFKLALAPVAEALRRRSPGLLAVDVTQALGRIELDLAGADLLVSSTHKWILASHGGGIVGVPADRAEAWTVPAGGWFNLQDAFGAERFDRAVSRPGADSFMVGMPNYPAVYAVGAGLGYLDSVGVRAIAAHADPLVRHCLDELKRLPVELLTPDEPDALAGILAFRHEDTERLHAALHAADIHVMCHAGRLRVAIHGYNTAADVERLIAVLKQELRS